MTQLDQPLRKLGFFARAFIDLIFLKKISKHHPRDCCHNDDQ